ncbi:MAG: hypothetical protein C0598_08975 [Marinilabiliales bacterium]|nr:MAG: hypothetical protein C0598_08975 [Marinilabiliales bacterium]
MKPQLKKRLITSIEYLFFLGLGIALLWLSFHKLEYSEIKNDILNADYHWLFIALFFAIVSHIFRALRWNMLINSMGYKTKLSTTFFAVMIGYLANTAVPRMGEFMRCGVLSKKEKIPFNSLFGTVISERFFDLVMLAIIMFLVIAFQIDLVGAYVTDILEPVLGSVFSNIYSILLLFAAVIVLIGITIWFIWRSREWIKSFRFYNKVRGFIDGLLLGIKTIMKLKNKWLFFTYTLLIWFFYAIMVYMPVLMLQDTSHLTFIDALTILAIGSLGIVAPVPGGIGAYHFIVKSILVELYSIEGNAAGSFAAITHAGQTLLNVIVGSLSYFYMMIFTKQQKPSNE